MKTSSISRRQFLKSTGALIVSFNLFPPAGKVNRGNVVVNAAYTGVSSDQEGARDPRFGGYTYYAPLIFADQNGLNSTIYIQNSGDECTSLEIWFKAQDNCLRSILGDVLTLAPGESIRFDPRSVRTIFASCSGSVAIVCPGES